MSRVFSALAGVPMRLAHPNVTLQIVVTDEGEIRAVNQGWSRPCRRQVSLDHRLLDVVATHTLASMANLFAMLDAQLPGLVTTRDEARP